ncbi:MAG: hypothetical protein JXN62_12965 [Bacteroidales bacterium]|nr:hypothetical protein [Bacteroidales bacterium]
MKKIVRAGLFALLALLVFIIGNKVVTGKECTGCPGRGICNGETDCSKYKISE